MRFCPSGNAFFQGSRIQVFLVVRIAIGSQPQVLVGIFVQACHLVDNGGRSTCCDGFGKFQCIRRFHAHATMAADAGHAGRGIGAVNTQAQFGVAKTDKYRTQRIIRAGRYAFYAVIAFFLDGFRDVPNRVVGFGADFVFAQSGLGHGFADGNRINFAQFAVVVEEQTLLRNIDNDVLSGRGGRDVWNKCVCSSGRGQKGDCQSKE